jgi:hypothetical protein
MGIRDRDYMRRPPDDDGQSGSLSDSKAEEFAQRILKKYSRLFLYVGIAIGVLLVIAFIVAKFSNTQK